MSGPMAVPRPEDRVVIDIDANDAQFGMRENLSSTAGPGGSTFRTGYTNGSHEGFFETDLGVGPGNDIVTQSGLVSRAITALSSSQWM